MTDSAMSAAGPRIALSMLIVSIMGALAVPAEIVIRWTREGGPIEDATVVLYALAAAAVLALRGSAPRRIVHALALTMLAFAAREAHWHIDFTGTSMLRASYYWGPAPAMVKLASFAIVAVLLSAWAALALDTVRSWRVHRLNSRVLKANIAAFLVVLVGTKLLDRLLSILAEDLGIAAGETMRALQVGIEEPMEMALPLMVVGAVWQHLIGTRRRPGGAAEQDASRTHPQRERIPGPDEPHGAPHPR